MHLPFTPNHVQLINACYPPSATLLSAGPEYRPNSQELSKLTYYAANRPAKLNKLGSELEKRIVADCRRAQAGNVRSKASLLISISVMRALAADCRRDIALLTPSLLAAAEISLSLLSSDLEVSAKVASMFTTWTTYTDGRLIGVDNAVTKDYMSILKRFTELSIVNLKSHDEEVRNRTRLVGLAALASAVTSEALYSSSQFASQVSTIVPAIMANVLEVEVSNLDMESAAMKEKPISPYMDEFRTRPAVERRAASIHLHIDGERGPSSSDVTSASLRVLYSLLDHSNGAQASHIMQAALDSMNVLNGWAKIDHCRWLARKAADWTQYQYRYAIPTRLVERLQENQDAPVTSSLHSSLAAMITTVFVSPTPLVNLSTSDVISNLITLVVRRTAIDPSDSLLPALTQCISSLGTHIYYADQIHDLASELISRLVSIEAVGVQGRNGPGSPKGRSEAIRCLLAGLVGLIETPNKQVPGSALETKAPPKLEQSSTVASVISSVPITNGNTPSSPTANGSSKPTRRTKVSPETWQDTLNLICDADYPVRADYIRALIFYIGTEISKRGEYTDADGVYKIRPLAEGPIRQGANFVALLNGDSSSRLLNAVFAYLFILATSASLGIQGLSGSPASNAKQITDEPASEPMLTVVPPTPMDSTSAIGHAAEKDDGAAGSQHNRRSMSIQARARRQSTIQRLLEHVPSQLSASVCATASDYRNILTILEAIDEHLPLRGLLTGVPFLVALDGIAKSAPSDDPAAVVRARAIKEVLTRTWLAIGKTWACAELVDIAEKALTEMPKPSALPPAKERLPGVFTTPESPIDLALPSMGAGTETQWSGVDVEAVLKAISSSSTVLDATHLDEQTLLRRFAVQWTPESAMKESTEPQATYDALRGEGGATRLKLAPALMHIENMSLASLTRSTRGVGVTDLRDALEGRPSMSNPALVNKAPSVSTLDHTSMAHTHHTHTSLANTTDGLGFHKLTPTKSRGTENGVKQKLVTGSPSEVKDMLNKLRIGKQGGGSMLKSSFPALQRQDGRPSTSPPYKS